jgi:hypothetical protein
MKHAQRTEKYIRLIFNSYISDGDFFCKPMCIIDTNYFFSGRRGVHYAILMTVQTNIFYLYSSSIEIGILVHDS